MQNKTDLQYLLDRSAIHDVLAGYFQGLDKCDMEQVRRCFTDDVLASYDGRTEVKGIDAFMDSMRTFKRHKNGEVRVTTHFMGNLNFCSLQADLAATETNVIAYLVLVGERADYIAVRSLRYLDRLRRTDAGWKIAARVHTLDWSCEVPAKFATTLTQRRIAHLDLE